MNFLPSMSVHLTPLDVVVRLFLALAAGMVLGFNRSQRGRPAGLRTTILVALAAAGAMIETNLLLGTDQEGPAAYVRMDVMRLPLGLLTGIGFIGAGAIIKRGQLVEGVTTAATLWLMTVIGLIFGGGQLLFGGVLTAAAAAVLWLLKLVETRVRQELRGSLLLAAGEAAPADAELRAAVERAGYRIIAWSAALCEGGARRDLFIDVSWRQHGPPQSPPPFLETFAHTPGVERTEWKPHSEHATPH